MPQVTSADGTAIGFDRTGSGPPLVLVDGALCFRQMGPMPALSELLASHFTLYHYDRRGRGESGDEQPYAVEREIEDLAAVIEAAGGRALVYGVSSGAVLALEGALAGLPIDRLVLFEPPYSPDDAPPDGSENLLPLLVELAEAGRHEEMVEAFLSMTGMPPEALAGMRETPAWAPMVLVAPTLIYEHHLLGDSRIPAGRARALDLPALVLAGGASPDWFRAVAQTLASAIPGAELRILEGQTHEAAPEVIAPELVDFLT